MGTTRTPTIKTKETTKEVDSRDRVVITITRTEISMVKINNSRIK